ncbi:MAG: 50S ribosomal protein L13 [Candidatus Levybacteria bacterium RIFCSPHIGHO2_01_FULL_40_10]|nr:MAG: 50S ribosomal protein L13 [Candidatus Levybacteria bacterium RIFCSPHIGHO2_01_FULL_40_10]
MLVTKPTKTSEIERAWHLVDINGKILGRVAGEIAKLLMGKSKPYFAKNLDCGDFVVVVNSAEVKVTGKKEKDKVYTRYSGYPGGLRKITLGEMRAQKPEEIIRHAVSGMLPKNKLRASMLKRLFVFKGAEHKYQDKFNQA